MNKEDLIKNVSHKTNMTKKEINLILTTILEVIMTTVSRGESVRLVGFGSFRTFERRARKGRNPKTGASVKIPSSRVPKFSAGKFFKEKVSTIK